MAVGGGALRQDGVGLGTGQWGSTGPGVARTSRAGERSEERGPVRGREKREREGRWVGPPRVSAPPVGERKGEREEYDRWAPVNQIKFELFQT
jgi:hypothetical protein